MLCSMPICGGLACKQRGSYATIKRVMGQLALVFVFGELSRKITSANLASPYHDGGIALWAQRYRCGM